MMNLVRWVFAQLGQFLSLLVRMVLGGVVLAIARRQFHWTAFIVGLLVLLAGAGSTGLMVHQATFRDFGSPDAILWSGVLSTFILVGFLIGLIGRRVGFWEIYLATVLGALLCGVYLATGFEFLGLDPTALSEPAMFMEASGPGDALFGPMWDRMLVLAAVIGFLLAVLGGSFAFLFFSEGRFDRGFTFEWAVTRRHLTGRTGMISITAVVAVVGIALGVAALIAVTAVMSGYQDDIRSKILSTNAHLVVQKYGVDFKEYRDVQERALALPGVTAATPFTFNEAILSNGERGVGVLIKGVEPQTAPTVTAIATNVCANIDAKHGCIDSRRGEPAILIDLLKGDAEVPAMIVGNELFKRLKLPIGALVTLTTPVGIAGARGNAPKRMDFRLTGVFRSGMHEFDSRLVYVDLAASQSFMGMRDSVSGVEFRVQDPERVEHTAKQVLTAIGRYPYRTLDWRELNSGIFTALKLQKIVMFLVLTFIVIVAAFNIASTLFMAVVEKAREIAVLKSMGARDASIMKVFVLHGWITGGTGTLLGLLLGLGISYLLSTLELAIAADVYMVESLQVQVQPLEVLLTVFAALVISHLATLYPALKAARQHPVDAMRTE